jgi:hypothetical protein
MSYKRLRVPAVRAQHGVSIVREGGPHTIVGRAGGPYTSLPRHRELNRLTVRAIVKQLGLDWTTIQKELR